MFTFSVIRSLDRLGSQFIRTNLISHLTGGERCLSYKSASNIPSQPRTRAKTNTRARNVEQETELVNNDPDVFGAIGEDQDLQLPLKAESLPDDEDGYDKLEINRDRRHIIYYKHKLTSLIHGGKGKADIVQALKLFDQMKSDDRKKVKPFMYTLLISGAAENGYTQKAFDLFEEALRHKLKPTHATITSLFNACAECPFKEMGLEKAEWLRRWIKEVTNFNLNRSQYHAMIKAFGKLGDLKTVYEIVDEMTEKDISIDTTTFNHLLVASISQPETGFGEAIKLYRRMRFHKIPRDLKTYNLLLKATKECTIGGKENFSKLIHQWLNMDKILYNEKRRPVKHVKLNKGSAKSLQESNGLRISFSDDKVYDYLPDGRVKLLDMPESKEEDGEEKNHSSSEMIKLSDGASDQLTLTKPNFLVSSKYLQMSSVVNINYDSLSDWKNRFLLIGGVEGFLHILESESIKPDVKTFTMMLDLVPENNQVEDELIEYMKRCGVNPDTGLFNQIIKRRCYRNDIYAAKKSFAEMQLNQIPVDLATFGVLASGCKNIQMAKTLFNDMENVGLRPNIQIMGAMMKKACLSKDICTMKLIMRKMNQFGILADRRIIDVVLLTIEEIDKILWSIEKGKLNPFGFFLDPEYTSKFNKLKRFFEKWAANTEIEINQHPWDQFKYQRKDWQYLKMHKYEKTFKSSILDRPDVKQIVKSGQNVNVQKIIHDF